MAIGGQGQLFYYQAGIAPLVHLWSGSIATQFNPDGHSTRRRRHSSIPMSRRCRSDATSPYSCTGITFTTLAKADVVNSSWGFPDPGGDAFEPVAIDALVFANHTTFVAAAGNSGPGPNTVGAPASAYNKIAVASLAADNTANPYTVANDFSSRGPNDFVIPGKPDGSTASRVIPGVRPVVDIAAPGDALALAFYGGLTGSNTNGVLTDGVDPTNGANN